MPSWIKEHDGLEWYDEAYTVKQTNQKPAQLQKKADAGKLRCVVDPANGSHWYARPDVELLREAFLNRQAAAKQWKPTAKHIEARINRQNQADMERERKLRRQGSLPGPPPHRGPLAEHAERVMLKEIDLANAARKAEKDKD